MLAQFKLLLEYRELVKTTRDLRDVLATDEVSASRFITYTTFIGLLTAQKQADRQPPKVNFNPVLESLRPLIEASASELPKASNG